LPAGCGQGGNGTSAASEPSQAPESPPSTGSQQASTGQDFPQSVRRVQQERQSRAGEGTASAEETGRPPVPSDRDSGGGAAQFRGSGDNSIQESGVEASASEREQAAASLHGYLDSHAAGHWAAACHYLSATVVAGLERIGAMTHENGGQSGCAAALATLSRGVQPSVLREGARADVGSLRVNGDKGFALYHGARGTSYAMPMVQESGEWKVAALAGAPLSR
jgi:hypothetical protein